MVQVGQVHDAEPVEGRVEPGYGDLPFGGLDAESSVEHLIAQEEAADAEGPRHPQPDEPPARDPASRHLPVSPRPALPRLIVSAELPPNHSKTGCRCSAEHLAQFDGSALTAGDDGCFHRRQGLDGFGPNLTVGVSGGLEECLYRGAYIAPAQGGYQLGLCLCIGLADSGQNRLIDTGEKVMQIQFDAEALTGVARDQAVIDSLKTLRELIRFKIMSYVESARRQMLEKAITDRLLEENPFQISKGLIASTLKQIAANVSISEDDRDEFIEQHRQEAEADLRWVELRNEIARVEEITVTDEMVESELRRYAEQSGEPVEKIRKKIETEGGIESLRKRMIDRDVMDFLITNADIEKRTMNLDEFFRLSRSQLEE